MNPGFVVAMGIGTVFVGLIAIIFVCMIMSAIVRSLVKAKPEAAKGQYMRSCVLATIMVPGIKLMVAKFGNYFQSRREICGLKFS